MRPVPEDCRTQSRSHQEWRSQAQHISTNIFSGDSVPSSFRQTTVEVARISDNCCNANISGKPTIGTSKQNLGNASFQSYEHSNFIKTLPLPLALVLKLLSCWSSTRRKTRICLIKPHFRRQERRRQINHNQWKPSKTPTNESVGKIVQVANMNLVLTSALVCPPSQARTQTTSTNSMKT